jgi:hydrogenase maturation protein HypF
MLDRNFNSPMTSSAGRIFDAVASLIGIRDRVSYEGQAAMELEWLAATVEPRGSYAFGFDEGGEIDSSPAVIDIREMIRAISRDVDAGLAAETISRKFHTTFVEIIVATCIKLAQRTGVSDLVFSGGVFLNALLSAEAAAALAGEGFRVHRHKLVPTNDGGLSLGQLAIAASAMNS